MLSKEGQAVGRLMKVNCARDRVQFPGVTLYVLTPL